MRLEGAPCTESSAVMSAGANQPDSIGLRGVAGVLPPERLSLDELSARGWLVSEPQRLVEFGFSHVHVADETHDLRWLAREAARQALADAKLAPADIDLLIWASALDSDHRMPLSTGGEE